VGDAGVILVDTHILIWWVDGSNKLPSTHEKGIKIAQASDGIAISIISLWEIAKKVENGKLTLTLPVGDWIDAAQRQPGIAILPLTPEIILDSTQLPNDYNKTNSDPADQLIIATSRIENVELMTLDSKMLRYTEVHLWKPN
jgi:PIN domain nuclease of toxin-antitoxin system